MIPNNHKKDFVVLHYINMLCTKCMIPGYRRQLAAARPITDPSSPREGSPSPPLPLPPAYPLDQAPEQ